MSGRTSRARFGQRDDRRQGYSRAENVGALALQKYGNGLCVGMGVEPVNYAAYFVICFAVCVLAAVSLLMNMAKTSSEGEVANR